MILSLVQDMPIPSDPFREEGHPVGDSLSSTTKEVPEKGAVDQPQQDISPQDAPYTELSVPSSLQSPFQSGTCFGMVSSRPFFLDIPSRIFN
jgi:hypothetical protein